MKRRHFIASAVLAAGALALRVWAQPKEAGGRLAARLGIPLPKFRLPGSAPGRFFVDSQLCIACGACAAQDPAHFAAHPRSGIASVRRRPNGPQELAAYRAAIAACPVGAIAEGRSARGRQDASEGRLSFTRRPAGGVSIFDLRGQLAGPRTISALRRALGQARRGGHRKVLLNLAEVTLIDDAAAGALVSESIAFAREGGQLKLLHLSKKVKDLLIITKLTTVFDTFDNEAEAVRSFAGGAEASPPSEGELERKVRQIIVDELGVEPGEVTPEARFIDDLGADSLDTVELVMRFEEEFGIEIPDEDAEKIERVRDAYAYLTRRGAKPRTPPAAPTPSPAPARRPPA